MKQALDTRTKLLTKSPWPLMIELSIPAVLGMVVVGLYNMMDSIFVGQMVGDVQMGAISVSYPLTLINAGSAAMLGVGSASVLSRAIGKKDENTIKKIMGNLVAMVLLLSVIYTVVGMVFTRQLLSLTGASDNILNYAEKYLRIIFAGSLFVNFFQSANMVIRGEGQLKKAMTIIASGAILNIILDPIFISILNPYGMGIEAAAYATIFSQFVQAAITLWYFKKKSPHVKIGRIRIDGELLPQVLSVGVSALLMQILTLVQQTVIYRVASNYGGETSQLLLGAALRFWNFSFVPLWGISQGFQPAAGTNLRTAFWRSIPSSQLGASVPVIMAVRRALTSSSVTGRGVSLEPCAEPNRMRLAIRLTSTVVLPLPAPARMSSGPSVVNTACRCISFRRPNCFSM